MCAPAPPSSLSLRTVGLLASLPLAALDDIAARCAWRRFRKGQTIVARSSSDRDVLLIIAGRVRVAAYSASGRAVTFREMQRGECFGELAALDGRRRSVDVVALEDVLVASIAPAHFGELLHAHPPVCDALLSQLVHSIRDLTARVFELSTRGVQSRLRSELLRRARHAGVQNNRATIDPAPKHADLANQISTAREQVTRELSELVRRGLLVRSDRALVVVDVEALEKLVAKVGDEI